MFYLLTAIETLSVGLMSKRFLDMLARKLETCIREMALQLQWILVGSGPPTNATFA
jgi:hypothetical protein